MIIRYRNSIAMVYEVTLSDGLKTTFTIVIRLSKLETLYLAVTPLPVVDLTLESVMNEEFKSVVKYCLH